MAYFLPIRAALTMLPLSLQGPTAVTPRERGCRLASRRSQGGWNMLRLPSIGLFLGVIFGSVVLRLIHGAAASAASAGSPTELHATEGPTPMHEHLDSPQAADSGDFERIEGIDSAARPGLLGRLTSSLAGRSVLSLAAIGAVGSIGMFATQAGFTDQVTMAQISVMGGTLDLTANGGNGPTQAWTGQVAAAITNMAPGDEKTGTVVIKNNGTLPFTLTASGAGTDASGCFSYYFRQTAKVAGATGDSSGNLANFGTAAGDDSTTVPFATSVTPSVMGDVAAGSDNTWETDDEKTYTVTVRMKTACATNGAAGTLNLSFNATQV